MRNPERLEAEIRRMKGRLAELERREPTLEVRREIYHLRVLVNRFERRLEIEREKKEER